LLGSPLVFLGWISTSLPYIPICVWGHNSHGSSSIHPIPLIWNDFKNPTLATKLIQKKFALLLLHDWMLTVSAVLLKTMGWATLLSVNIVTVVDCLNININILSNYVCLVLGTISIIHYSKLIGGYLIDK
jgi:hypothetical protein